MERVIQVLNRMNGDGGNFDRIFLFHFLWGKEEAYRIF
jgi:hypothetical protein